MLFDLCNEGPSFIAELFDCIHGFLDENYVPAQQAVWLAQNRAIEAAYRAHYEGGRESLMGFEYYDFFVKLIAALFAAPEAAAGLKMNLETPKDRLFLCLNATPRLHRVLALAALLHAGLLERGLVSFPGLNTRGIRGSRSDSGLRGQPTRPVPFAG